MTAPVATVDCDDCFAHAGEVHEHSCEVARRLPDGRLAVVCDEWCGAPEEPKDDDIEELRAALEHWRNHSRFSGCSHGH